MINFFKALRCLVVPGLFEFEKKEVGDFEKNRASANFPPLNFC